MKQDLFKQLENVPCFSKADLRMVFSGSENALNERIKRAIKNKVIIQLKKGFYTTYLYWLKEPNKTVYLEFIASKLRYPSYLSMEYVLAENNLLTEAIYAFTSVTLKSGRSYQNSLASFYYRSVKESLFAGYEKKSYRANTYFIAKVSKALFDWFYLKKNIAINKDEIIEGLRINWENFSKKDFQEFKQYVKLSKSQKMNKISKIIGKEIYAYR